MKPVAEESDWRRIKHIPGYEISPEMIQRF